MTIDAVHELLLRYYRAPYLFKDYQNPAGALPEGLIEALRVAIDNGAKELREAAVNFVCSILLVPSASHYRALSLEKNAPSSKVDEHYHVIATLLANAEFASALEHHRQRLFEAYSALKDPSKRAMYDANPKVPDVDQLPNDRHAAKQPKTRSYPSFIQQILDFHAHPSRYPDWINANAALPKGVTVLFEYLLATASTAPESHASEMPDQALNNAAWFFVNRALIIGNHYRTLGLTEAATSDDIQHHYRCLRRLCQAQQDDGATRHAIARISDAYVTLRDTFKRALYDDALRGGPSAPKTTPPPFKPPQPQVMDEVIRTPTRAPAAEIIPEVINTQVRPAMLGAREWAPPRRLNWQLPLATVLALAAIGSAVIFYTPRRDIPPPPSEASAKPILKQQPVATITPSPLAIPPPLQQLATPSPAVNEEALNDQPAMAQEPLVRQDDDQSIAQLLFKAERELGTLHLTSPPGDNAFATYREVLARDYRNKKAREGLRRIADKYVSLARTDINNNELISGFENITKGLTVLPDHKALLTLHRDIKLKLSEQARQSDERMSARQTNERRTNETELAAFPSVESSSALKETEVRVTSPAQVQAPAVPVIIDVPVSAPPEVAPKPPATERFNNTVNAAAITSISSLRTEINREELDSLVNKFVDAYERGNLSQFTQLFASDARANNRSSLAGIVEDYRTLFETTDTRLMVLNGLQWRHASQRATGDAQFKLTIKRKGSDEKDVFDGNITLEIEKQAGHARITGLFHSQRRER